jgi:hypothetical protein
MRRFLILLLLLMTFPTVAAAQAAPPTLDAYEGWLRTAYAAATRADRIGLDAVAAQLTAIRAVQLPDGATVAVDTGWLTDALAQEPPDYPLVTGRIGAMLDALAQPQGTPPADAQQRLDAVFNSPPFVRPVLPAFITNAWNAFLDAVNRFFNWLFGRLVPAGGVGSVSFSGLSALGWFLLIVGLVLVLGLLLYAVRGVRGSLRRDQAVRAAADEAQLSSSDALERAQDLVRGGDHRSAVRYLYLSSLLWLDEHKLLRYDRSLTNREYLAQVQANSALHERLTPVVSTFDRVWYGQRPIDDAGLQAYQEQVEALRREEPLA